MDEKMIKNNIDSQKIQCGKEFLTCIRVFAVFALLLGIIYPLGITAVAQLAMPYQANGSLIKSGDNIVGSEKIAQKFEGDKYFHPRPSFTNYNAAASGASNYGPNSEKLKKDVEQRIEKYKKVNNINTNVNIPSDAVTTSGSGLDPNISINNAKLQLKRVAFSRKLSENELEKIVKQNIDKDFIGIWGQKSVNVIKLNKQLDDMESESKGK